MVKDLLKRGLGLRNRYDVEVAEIIDDEIAQGYNDSRIETDHGEALEKSVRAKREPLEENDEINFIAKVLEREHPVSGEEDTIYLMRGNIEEQGTTTVATMPNTWEKKEYHPREDIRRKNIRLGEKARGRDLSDDKYLKGSFMHSVHGSGLGAIPAWKVDLEEVEEYDGEEFEDLTYEEIREELK
jgi:hypothetical protein